MLSSKNLLVCCCCCCCAFVLVASWVALKDDRSLSSAVAEENLDQDRTKRPAPQTDEDADEEDDDHYDSKNTRYNQAQQQPKSNIRR